MEMNRGCIFLLFLSLFLLLTLFGATQSHARSIQSADAIVDSGKEINLATNFTQIEKISAEGHIASVRHALLGSTKTSDLKSVSKKDKDKKKKKKKKKKSKSSAAATSHGSPSLALLFCFSMLGLTALLAS